MLPAYFLVGAWLQSPRRQTSFCAAPNSRKSEYGRFCKCRIPLLFLSSPHKTSRQPDLGWSTTAIFCKCVRHFPELYLFKKIDHCLIACTTFNFGTAKGYVAWQGSVFCERGVDFRDFQEEARLPSALAYFPRSTSSAVLPQVSTAHFQSCKAAVPPGAAPSTRGRRRRSRLQGFWAREMLGAQPARLGEFSFS